MSEIQDVVAQVRAGQEHCGDGQAACGAVRGETGAISQRLAALLGDLELVIDELKGINEQGGDVASLPIGNIDAKAEEAGGAFATAAGGVSGPSGQHLGLAVLAVIDIRESTESGVRGLEQRRQGVAVTIGQAVASALAAANALRRAQEGLAGLDSATEATSSYFGVAHDHAQAFINEQRMQQ